MKLFRTLFGLQWVALGLGWAYLLVVAQAVWLWVIVVPILGGAVLWLEWFWLTEPLRRKVTRLTITAGAGGAAALVIDLVAIGAGFPPTLRLAGDLGAAILTAYVVTLLQFRETGEAPSRTFTFP